MATTLDQEGIESDLAKANHEAYCANDSDSLIATAKVFNSNGDAEYSKDDFRSAIDNYTKGIELNCLNEQIKVTLHTSRANAHYYLGNYRDALNDAKLARKFEPTCIAAIERGANALTELEDYEEAVKWCDEGLAIVQQNETLMNLRERCFEELTELQNDEQDHDEEEDSYERSKAVIRKLRKALFNSRESGDKIGEGIAYGNLGNAYGSLGDHKLSIEYYKLSLDVAKEIRNKAAECASYCNIGNVYYRLRDFNQAIEYHSLDLSTATEMGDAVTKERAYCNLGNSYRSLGDFRKAIEYHKLSLSITEQLGDKSAEARASGNLGNSCYSLGDFKQAIVFQTRCLTIAEELGDRAEEGRASGNLGNAYRAIGSYKEAVDYHKRFLVITRELGNRRREAIACGNLGNSCRCLGEIKEAIKYHELSLDISREVGDKKQEANAYGNLGNAYQDLGDYEQAIKYHKLCLDIDEELGDTVGKARAYGNLGNAYDSIGDFKQAIAYFKPRLEIYQNVGDTAGEGRAYGSLGSAYFSLGDFGKALQYHMSSLDSLEEVADKAGMGRTYGNIGIVYDQLGDYKRAIEYHELSLKTAQELGEKISEGQSYGSLGNVYANLGDLEKATEYFSLRLELVKQLGNKDKEGEAYGQLGTTYYGFGEWKKSMKCHEMCLNIAKEVGNKVGEATAYCNLGLVFEKLGDVEKSIEYYEKCLDIAKELEHKATEGTAYANLGCSYYLLGEYQRAMEYDERRLNLAKETGDKAGEGSAYYNKGRTFEALGSFDEALSCFKTSFQHFNKLRSLLQSNDEWKISLRNDYQDVYTALWKLLLKLNKIDEALCTAEQGRAQALTDLMMSHYGIETDGDADQSCQEDFNLADTLKRIKSNVVFLAIHGNHINTLLLQEGECTHFKEVDFGQLTGNSSPDLQSYVSSVVKQIYDGAECEDRSLDSLYSRSGDNVEDPQLPLSESGISGSSSRNDGIETSETLRTLYEATISQLEELICGKDLIIVPDGPLFLAPFAAFLDPSYRYLSESFNIRVLPSLTSLKLIEDSPPEYHSNKGALIVGDPCLEEIVKGKGRRKKKLFKPLPCAKREAEMIGSILNIPPLTGKMASKAEVLRRLNSVSLVHIAAHGKMETGEIALSPNPTRTSQIPKQEDFLLTMADVLSTGLCARLVVLSCCHSGCGEIMAEGVVGIARSFLGAGARSVLVSLWAINDEATMEFMQSFYQNLMDGKSASASLNLAMKFMREESEKFQALNYWAPFVLLGDDVTLNFAD